MAYIKIQNERIKNNLCKDCGKERSQHSNIRCDDCKSKSSKRESERKKNLRKEWKTDGSEKCHSCGRASETKSCSICRERSKKYKPRNRRIRIVKRVAGKCRHCSKQAMEKRCKSCWTKDLLRKHNIDVNLWELFWKKLEDQNFKCFYTGIPIVPEINASLDHVIPKAKGGTNDFDNLVWCDRKINSFKNDNDYESLINICLLILDRHQQRQAALK